jgi:hypothetical protein
MPPTQKDDTFSLGADILGTNQGSQGTVLGQTGDVVNEEVASDNVEFWGPIGLIARPAKAVPQQHSCQAITINQGSNDVAIAYRDLRVNIALADGEVAIFAPGADGTGTTRILLQDGTITITGGTVNVVGNVVLGAAGDKAPLDSKVQTELGKIAQAFSSFIPGTGGASFASPYTSPGATASSKVQLT